MESVVGCQWPSVWSVSVALVSLGRLVVYLVYRWSSCTSGLNCRASGCVSISWVGCRAGLSYRCIQIFIIESTKWVIRICCCYEFIWNHNIAVTSKDDPSVGGRIVDVFLLTLCYAQSTSSNSNDPSSPSCIVRGKDGVLHSRLAASLPHVYHSTIPTCLVVDEGTSDNCDGYWRKPSVHHSMHHYVLLCCYQSGSRWQIKCCFLHRALLHV